MWDSLQNFLICNVKTPTWIQFWYWTVRTMYEQLCTYIVLTAMYVHCTYGYVCTLYVRLCMYIVRMDPYVQKTFIPNVICTKSICTGLYLISSCLWPLAKYFVITMATANHPKWLPFDFKGCRIYLRVTLSYMLKIKKHILWIECALCPYLKIGTILPLVRVSWTAVITWLLVAKRYCYPLQWHQVTECIGTPWQ